MSSLSDETYPACAPKLEERKREGIAIRANAFSAKRAQEGEGAELLNSLLDDQSKELKEKAKADLSMELLKIYRK